MNRYAIGMLLLGLAAPVQAGDGLHLQSLVPTSGETADVLLDGDRESSWSPAGDPAGEGVLLRFEQPQQLDKIQLLLCEGSGQFDLVPYINGTSLTAKRKGVDGEEFEIVPGPAQRNVRSLFLRIAAAQGVPCLAEVNLYKGQEQLKVKPPRFVDGSVEASSTLKPIDAYHVGYLFDGRTDFGWVEGARGLGIGESITLTLDEATKVHSLELWNGYQRSKDHFKKNARARTLTLTIDQGEPLTLQVKDKMGPQTLKLPQAVEGKVFKLTIKRARPGKRYKDLVLSELRLWDGTGPMTVHTSDMEDRREVLEKQVSETALESVVDRQFVCRCDNMRATRLKLRSNHTFVWYQDVDEEGPDSNRSESEVFDGAWVMGKHEDPTVTFKLFGRRHKTSSEYNPYAGNRVRDTVRIGGGNVQLTRVADIGPAEFLEFAKAWASGPAGDKVGCLGLGTAEFEKTWQELKEQEAIILRGKAMTDLMIRDKR